MAGQHSKLGNYNMDQGLVAESARRSDSKRSCDLARLVEFVVMLLERERSKSGPQQLEEASKDRVAEIGLSIGDTYQSQCVGARFDAVFRRGGPNVITARSTSCGGAG